MFPPLASLLALFISTSFLALAAPPLLEAPTPAAVPANQLAVSGNACGPTALLNAFRLGSPAWQRAAESATGTTDKARIYTIIREIGMRPSSHLQGRPRWSKKGVSIADLCDMANEMALGKYLPAVRQEILFRQPRETPENLLKRTYARLATSMKKGLPPLLSLRRYALRAGQWTVLDAHFVTITALPTALEKSASSFPVTYLDPWGGTLHHGRISLSQQPILAATADASPCLAAEFPDALVGKKLLRPGEPTALALAASLGRW